ncbi:MAG: methyltransferase family protein [Planctomycetota bacterium]|jgi:protein-S-isoprenylcysteine O-methyltransferase Ste14
MSDIHMRGSWLPIVPIAAGIILPYLATHLDPLLPEVSLGSLRWAGVPEESPTATGIPKHLIVSGPYRYVRNPMLLGMVLIVLGEALFTESPGIFTYLAAFFVFLNFIMIPGEERRLEERFGESYLRYKSKIRRWLPAASPYENNK